MNNFKLRNVGKTINHNTYIFKAITVKYSGMQMLTSCDNWNAFYTMWYFLQYKNVTMSHVPEHSLYDFLRERKRIYFVVSMSQHYICALKVAISMVKVLLTWVMLFSHPHKPHEEKCYILYFQKKSVLPSLKNVPFFLFCIFWKWLIKST